MAFVGAGTANAKGRLRAVHEWGTFTSLQGSDGVNSSGMFYEDEALPDFVHGRSQEQSSAAGKDLVAFCRPKCGDFDPTGFSVSQKMETPVIYFYADHTTQANVTVGFPDGIINEYYPKPVSMLPPIGEVSSVSGGKMKWIVDVLTGEHSLPKTEEGSIWNPSRQVGSNVIRSGDETEKFIFYRGLGSFDGPIRIMSDNDQIRIRNLAAESIPSVLLLHVAANRGEVVDLGKLEAGGQLNLSATEAERLPRADLDTYLSQAKSRLRDALVQSGLYEDEALAMVNTWERSYFRTPGLRLLYIVPNQWVERILPLTVTPKPEELVRTLVGRIEVLSANQERELIERLDSSNYRSEDVLRSLGRFGEPILQRLMRMNLSQTAEARATDLLKRIRSESEVGAEHL